MPNQEHLRIRIAVEAARIMAEEGVEDYGLARKKASERLGLATRRNLPTTEEIETALNEHQRLFGRADQALRLGHLRQLALEAMRFLAEFSPVLVGGVWNGGAGKFSPIRLHLYPHAPEEVMGRLWDARIPFEESSQNISRDGSNLEERPALQFYVDDARVELVLLPLSWKGHTLRKKGSPMLGGGLKEVEKLLAATTTRTDTHAP